MKKFALRSAALGAMLVCLLPTMQAHAQFWVASNGGGTTCSQSSPCGTFQAAHDAAGANTEINCLDSADFGRVTISKSITIDCTGTDSVIRVSSLSAVSVNTAGVVVTLRGLDIISDSGGAVGVNFLNGSELHVENCRVAGFGIAFGNGGGGIVFGPTVASGVTAKLSVLDSTLENNGVSTVGNGIIINPSGSGAVSATIERVQAFSNTHGIVADGTGSTGSIVVQVRDTMVAGSAGNGIWAKSSAGHAATGMVVDGTSAVSNAGTGILASGSGTLIHLAHSTVAGNGAGLTAQSGAIFSYQDNQASGNFTDGGPTGVLTME